MKEDCSTHSMTTEDDLRLLVFANSRILLDGNTAHAKTVINHLGFVVIENAFSRDKYYAMMRSVVWGLQETCGQQLDHQKLCDQLWGQEPYDVEDGEIPPPATRFIDRFERRPGGEIVSKSQNFNATVFEAICSALQDDVHAVIQVLCGDQHISNPRFFMSEFSSEGGDAMFVGKRNMAHTYRVFLLVEPGNRKLCFKPRGYNGYLGVRSGCDESWGTLVISKMATPHKEVICASPCGGDAFCREYPGDARVSAAFFRCAFTL